LFWTYTLWNVAIVLIGFGLLCEKGNLGLAYKEIEISDIKIGEKYFLPAKMTRDYVTSKMAIFLVRQPRRKPTSVGYFGQLFGEFAS